MKHMKFLSFFLGIAFAIIACSSNNETIPAPEVDPDGAMELQRWNLPKVLT